MIHHWKRHTKTVLRSHVERNIIWLIVVLLLSFHHLGNENLFTFNSPTNAVGKPSFADYKHGTLYFQIAS